MNKNMKIPKFIEIGVFLVLIITLIWFIAIAQTSGSKCMVNPIKYSVDYYSKLNNNSVSCKCSFEDVKLTSILANSSGTYLVAPYEIIENNSYKTPDFSYIFNKS